MDTKSIAEFYLGRSTKGSDLYVLSNDYLTQCQEVERLKAALLEAMEWNWLDDDAPPRFDIDNLPGLEDKQ